MPKPQKELVSGEDVVVERLVRERLRGIEHHVVGRGVERASITPFAEIEPITECG